MSTTTQVESFCESCGTRYAFEPRRSPKRHLVKVGKLVGLLPDDGDVDDSALVVSRDPFHGAFHFCLECRRFTCPTCWDAAAGFCRSCAITLSGEEDATEPTYVLDAETESVLRAAYDDLVRLGSGEAWQRLAPPPTARTEVVAAAAPVELGEAPGDELETMIQAGVAALAAREAAQAAQAARQASEAEQAHIAEELRLQDEAQRLAWEQATTPAVTAEADSQAVVAEAVTNAQAVVAEATTAEQPTDQAEADRLAWEQYQIEKAAWDKAEAERLAAEAEGQSVALEPAAPPALPQTEDVVGGDETDEAQRLAAEQAEADRLAWEQYEIEKAAWDKAEAARLAAEADAQRLAAEQDDPRVGALAASAALVAAASDPSTDTVTAAVDDLPLADEATQVADGGDGAVWESLAGALGPDVAPEPAPILPEAATSPVMPGEPAGPVVPVATVPVAPVPVAPAVPVAPVPVAALAPVAPTPQVPQVPPSHVPASAPWPMGAPPAGAPGWVPPPPQGWRPPTAGFNGAPFGGRPGLPMASQAQLRSGIRPCPRCDLALSANARFCRRCGLPQG